MKNKILFTFILTSLFFSACDKNSDGSYKSEVSNNTGSGGSTAKFTFNGNYMYVVEGRILTVYDVSDPTNTTVKNRIDLNNNGVETIFTNGKNLFFGTQNGMLIYGMNNPSTPDYISTYSHVVSCDPVVVSGDLAYVTLSTGTQCARGMNQLEVIDISDLKNPRLLEVYNHGNPKGLAVSGNYLYLCDMRDGFKVLDVTDYSNIVLKSTITSLLAHDVIKKGNILTITSKSGVYQYDCSDPLNLVFISKINAQ